MNFFELSNKELGKRSGIYKITYKDYIYIGSSKNLYSRLHEHRIKLIGNYHKNPILQNIHNKHGIMCFEVEIVEFCTPEIRIEREKHFIDFFKANVNLKDPVTSQLSEQSRKKLGESVRKGRAEGKYKTKYDFSKIEQYDLWGNYVHTFENITEAINALNISKNEACRLLRGYGKGDIHAGIRLRYAESKTPVKRFDKYYKKIGQHVDFYYVDDEGVEKFAFNSTKTVWEFIADYTIHHPNQQLILIPKAKNSVNLRNPSNEDNANPS